MATVWHVLLWFKGEIAEKQLILLKGQQRLNDYNQCGAFLSLLPFKIVNKTSEPHLRQIK